MNLKMKMLKRRQGEADAPGLSLRREGYEKAEAKVDKYQKTLF